jgi:hypothetical protein
MLDQRLRCALDEVADRAFAVGETPKHAAGGVFRCKDFVHGRSVQIAVFDVRAVLVRARRGQSVLVVNLQGGVVALVDIIVVIGRIGTGPVGVDLPQNPAVEVIATPLLPLPYGCHLLCFAIQYAM